MVDRALTLNDDLENVSTQLRDFYRAPPSTPLLSDNEHGQSASRSPDRLSAPVIDSSLSSPTFSIGDSDDEEDEAAEEDVHKLNSQSQLASSASSRNAKTHALRINVSAAEEDVEDERHHSPRSPAESKARGQLSEEGELAKK